MSAVETGNSQNVVAPMSKGPDARDRILDAAEQLFAVRGFEGVSTTQIAKAAGITQPLIHYHFKNKEALWKCTVARLFGRMRDEFEADVTRIPTTDGRRLMLEMVRAYVGFLARTPQFGQFILREGVEDSPRLQWMVENWLGPTSSKFGALFDRGRDEGWIKDIAFVQFFTVVTASAANFFALAPMVKSLHGIEPTADDHALTLSDTVVDMAANVMMGTAEPVRSDVVNA